MKNASPDSDGGVRAGPGLPETNNEQGSQFNPFGPRFLADEACEKSDGAGPEKEEANVIEKCPDEKPNLAQGTRQRGQ